jgi:hypothetical protein
VRARAGGAAERRRRTCWGAARAARDDGAELGRYQWSHGLRALLMDGGANKEAKDDIGFTALIWVAIFVKIILTPKILYGYNFLNKSIDEATEKVGTQHVHCFFPVIMDLLGVLAHDLLEELPPFFGGPSVTNVTSGQLFVTHIIFLF